MTSTLWKESVTFRVWLALCRLWRILCGIWEESVLRRVLQNLGRLWKQQARSSRVLRFLCREGRLSSAWERSLTCRGLSFLLCLPGTLLHALYNTFRLLFDQSATGWMYFEAGEQTAIAESWLILAMWVIPFKYWDNVLSIRSFLFLLLLFHLGAMRHRRFRLDLGNIGFYPLLFFCTLVLAVPLSYRSALSVRFFGYHLAAAMCVLATVSAVRNGTDLKRLAAAASGVVCVSSLYGVIQRMQGVKVVAAYVDAKLNPDMPGRVMSYFDNPNTFAEVLVILLPLTLGLALASRTRRGKLAAALVWVLGVAALLMTYSRAGWVGFALSIVVLILSTRPMLLLPLALFCLAAVPFLPSAVWTRITTITNMNDTTTSSRFPAYEAAWKAINEQFFTGVGLGTEAVKQYVKDMRLYKGSAPFVHAHNLYLEVWAETGIVGICALIGSILWGIKRGFRMAAACPRTAARTLTRAAAAGMCGIALCAVADYPWHYPRVMVIFWFLFAMTLAGAKVCRREIAAEAVRIQREEEERRNRIPRLPGYDPNTSKKRKGRKKRRR